jgi:hypothetical protein
MRNSEAAVEGERLSLEVQRVKREIEVAKTRPPGDVGRLSRCGGARTPSRRRHRALHGGDAQPRVARLPRAIGSNAGMISRSKSSTVRDASSK